MMRTAVLILALGSAAAVDLDAAAKMRAELDAAQGTSVELGSKELAEMKAGTFKSESKTYTVSAAALKAKVQAEMQKVENYQKQTVEANSMSHIMQQASTMTQSARLQEMAGLIEGKDKGTEMIKTLSSEAKDALAGLQKMWLDTTAGTMEKIQTIEEALPKGVEAMDPEKENAHKGAFMPIEEIVTPFMDHLKSLQSSFPELNPWTEKVHGFSTFFQKDSLEDMFGSNLPSFRKYKKEFSAYKKEHQEQILNFMELFQMDDILTVLQSPEF